MSFFLSLTQKKNVIICIFDSVHIYIVTASVYLLYLHGFITFVKLFCVSFSVEAVFKQRTITEKRVVTHTHELKTFLRF